MYRPPFAVHYQNLQMNFNDWLRTDDKEQMKESTENWDELECTYIINSCNRDPIKNEFDIDLKISIGYPGKATPFSQLTTKVMVKSAKPVVVENVIETVGIYVFKEFTKEIIALNLKDNEGTSFTIPPLTYSKEMIKERFKRQKYNLHFESRESFEEFLTSIGGTIPPIPAKTVSTDLTDEELKSVLTNYNVRYEVVFDN